MFLGKQRVKTRQRRAAPLIMLLLAAVTALTLTGCSGLKGSIAITDGKSDADFTAALSSWSSEMTRAFGLGKGDTLQVHIACEDGNVSLAIEGARAGEIYAGNNLSSMFFTVTAQEQDTYTLRLTGNNASGTVAVKSVAAD